MKKALLMAFVAMFCSFGAFAAEDNDKVLGERVFENSVNLKIDWLKLQGKGSHFTEGVDTYVLWKKKFGFGIDTTIGAGNFFDVRPYATANIAGPLSLIVGYDAVSTGARYIDYGVWYTPSIGPLNFFADVRNFSALSSEANTYVDAFVDITTSLNKTFSAGVDFEEIHQWNGKADDAYFGPVLYAKIGAMTLMTRFEWEYHWAPSSQKDGCNIRVALKIPFSAN